MTPAMCSPKPLAVFVLLAASSGLAGCKSSSDSDEAPAALPTASLTPPAAQLPVATGPVPATPPPAATPAAPPRAVAPGQPTPAPAASPRPDAGTSADAGKPDAAAADTGSFPGKLAACAEKCQGILQGCLTPTFPADGGLPQPKDPKVCQSAFDTCRTACAP
jgi:hypothetical protein